MRRLLGMLRDDDEQLRAPQPSLERLEALADELRASGLPVELEIEGEPNGIPPGVDVSGYRIVQEALTNVLKHAGPAIAHVRVRFSPEDVQIDVVDDGLGALVHAGGRERPPRDPGAGGSRRGRDRGRPAAGRWLCHPRPPPLQGRHMIRVLIADDQSLVRTGFRLILSGEPGIDVVGEARDGSEAAALAAELEPDVVLMDVRMPDVDGIEATRRIVVDETSPRVLVLTTFDLDDIVYDALRAGASGFLLKDAPEERLLTAIQVVAEGGSLFAPSVTRRLIEEFSRRVPTAPPRALEDLTTRELEVLRLLAQGRSNAEIAAHLVVSEHTVKTHVAHILQKLDLRDRTQAVVVAYESGLVRPGDATLPG